MGNKHGKRRRDPPTGPRQAALAPYDLIRHSLDLLSRLPHAENVARLPSGGSASNVVSGDTPPLRPQTGSLTKTIGLPASEEEVADDSGGSGTSLRDVVRNEVTHQFERWTSKTLWKLAFAALGLAVMLMIGIWQIVSSNGTSVREDNHQAVQQVRDDVARQQDRLEARLLDLEKRLRSLEEARLRAR